MIVIAYDDYNSNIPTPYDIVGSITTTIGHSALRNGWKIIEIYDGTEDNQQDNYKSI